MVFHEERILGARRIYKARDATHSSPLMGDKSPKANHKKNSQKQTKQSSSNQNKNQAAAAKQAAGQAKKK